MPNRKPKEKREPKPEAQPPLERMVIDVPMPEPFDLTFQKESENNRIIAAVESLKMNPGWYFMVQSIKANIEWLKDSIITKYDGDGKLMTEEQVDGLRVKIAYLREFIEKPDFFLKKLSKSTSPSEELDPYDQKTKG